MNRIYTDGTDWYTLPRGVLVMPGPLTLTGLDGAQISASPLTVAAYRVSAEDAMGQLVDDLWDDATPTIEAVLSGLTELLNRSDGGTMAGMLEAFKAARNPQSVAYQALTAQAEGVGADIGGPGGAAIEAFPQRLAEAIARQRMGEHAGDGVLDGLAAVEEDARVLLARLIAGGPRQAMRQCASLLAPLPGDCAAIFTEPVATTMVAHYANIFALPISPLPGRGGENRIIAATVDDIRTRTSRGEMFPRQYRQIVPHLRDGPVWVRWWWGGTAWDGLVRLPERWVWLPKPWRAL